VRKMTSRIEDITESDLVVLVNKGDQNAYNSLLKAHLPLIRYYGNRYFGPALMSGDLHQAGCIGLFVACKKYNSNKGLSFSNFAKIHIKHYIINAVIAALRKKHRILNQSISLDETPSSNEEKANRYKIIPSFDRSPEEIYINQEEDRELFEILKKNLSNLERTAIIGLMDGLAYKEIANLVGVGNKCIDNALSRAKGKLIALLYNNA
jgi:RNA polymerase sporulation-specific sigma factor